MEDLDVDDCDSVLYLEVGHLDIQTVEVDAFDGGVHSGEQF